MTKKNKHTLRPLFGSNRFNTRVLLKQLTEKFLVLRDKTLFKPIAAGQLGLVAGQLVAGQLVVEQLVVGQLVAGQQVGFDVLGRQAVMVKN